MAKGQSFKDSVKEFRAELKAKAKGGTFMSEAEYTTFLTNPDLWEKDEGVYLQEAKKGDFSHFEKLSDIGRVALASSFVDRNSGLFSGTPDEMFSKIDARNASSEINEFQNPLLRLGISLKMRTPLRGEDFKALDSRINERVMLDTLLPITKEDKIAVIEAVGQEKASEMIQRDRESKSIMAKTMLMAQLGGLVEATPDGEKPWEGSVANAFAHCSRVCVSMPGSEIGQDDLYHSFLHSQPGEGVMEKRQAATHSVERAEIATGLRMKEKKHKITHLSDQYGMNVAVGGLGKKGITGPDGKRVLLNDGSCGHMYMHAQKGDREHYGGMLIGFESDAAGITNQSGHTHDIFATPEKASPFGGLRTDEIGFKYDGRRIDLRNLTPDELNEVFTAFEYGLDQMEDDKKRLMLSRMCGARMSESELGGFLAEFGIDPERAKMLAAKGLNPPISQKAKDEMAFIFANADKFKKQEGGFETLKQEEIPKDIQSGLDGLQGADKRASVERVKRIYADMGIGRKEQKDIADRMGVVSEASQLFGDDPQTAMSMSKAAVTEIGKAKKKDETARMYEGAALRVMRDMIDPSKYDQAVKDLDKLEADVASFKKNELGKDVFKDITVAPDEDKMKGYLDKMSSSKRSFLGIGAKNSQEYEDVIASLRWVEETKDSPDKEERNLAYRALEEACIDYAEKHQRSRFTKEGAERLRLVGEVRKECGEYFEKQDSKEQIASADRLKKFEEELSKTKETGSKGKKMNLAQLMQEDSASKGKSSTVEGRKKSLHEKYKEMEKEAPSKKTHTPPTKPLPTPPEKSAPGKQ